MSPVGDVACATEARRESIVWTAMQNRGAHTVVSLRIPAIRSSWKIRKRISCLQTWTIRARYSRQLSLLPPHFLVRLSS